MNVILLHSNDRRFGHTCIHLQGGLYLCSCPQHPEDGHMSGRNVGDYCVTVQAVVSRYTDCAISTHVLPPTCNKCRPSTLSQNTVFTYGKTLVGQEYKKQHKSAVLELIVRMRQRRA